MTWNPFRHESSSRSGTEYDPPAGPPSQYNNYSAEKQPGFSHSQAQDGPPPEYSAERNHFPSERWRPQQSHNHPQQQNYTPSSQYNGPREGFTNLPPRFYMWCRGGDTTISMGAQSSGTAAYAAHFSTSPASRTTFTESSGRVIAESSKPSDWNPATLLQFQGYQTNLTEAPPCYRFQAPVQGRVDGFEWRPWHARGPKSMVLMPQGASSNGTTLATWIASGAAVSQGGGDLGFFEFVGPTMTGAMGDVFMALAIMSVARIYHGEYERTPNMNMVATSGMPAQGMPAWNMATMAGGPAHGASAWHMAGGSMPMAGMYQSSTKEDDEEKEKERKRKKKKKDEEVAIMAAIAAI